MRIRDSFTSMAVTRHFDDIRSKSAYTQRQMGAGETLITAKDDTANFSISQRLRAQIESSQRAVKNAQDGITLMQEADGGIQSIVDNLQKARSLAIYSASDAITDSDRATVNKEFQMYIDEINRQSQATNYNGKQLIDGTGEQSLKFHVGANEADSISFNLPTVTADSLGVTGTSVATREDAENALSIFDTAVLRLGVAKSDIGAFVNRLENAEGYTQIQNNNNSAANSKIKDIDIAEGSIAMAKEKIQYEAASVALSKSSSGNSAAAALLQLGI